MSDDNKVVPFPAHKTRKVNINASQNSTELTTPNRRMTILISLVTTILVATLINSRINLNQDVRSGRGLASSQMDLPVRDIGEDLLLAKKIARESLRQPASRGRYPTSEEKLQFETLNPSYLLNINLRGELESISYVENSGPLKPLKRPQDFIIQNMDLLKINFDEIKPNPVRTFNEKFKFEVYELVKKGQAEPVARIHFTYDNNNNFISMKVESSS